MLTCRFRYSTTQQVETIELPTKTTILFLRQTLGLSKNDRLKLDNVTLRSSQTLEEFKDQKVLEIEIEQASTTDTSPCSSSGSEGYEQKVRVISEEGERTIKTPRSTTIDQIRKQLDLDANKFEFMHLGQTLKDSDNISNLVVGMGELVLNVSPIKDKLIKINIIVDLFGTVKKYRIYPRVKIGKLREALNLEDSNAVFKHSNHVLDDEVVIGSLEKEEEAYIVLEVIEQELMDMTPTPGMVREYNMESESPPNTHYHSSYVVTERGSRGSIDLRATPGSSPEVVTERNLMAGATPGFSPEREAQPESPRHVNNYSGYAPGHPSFSPDGPGRASYSRDRSERPGHPSFPPSKQRTRMRRHDYSAERYSPPRIRAPPSRHSSSPEDRQYSPPRIRVSLPPRYSESPEHDHIQEGINIFARLRPALGEENEDSILDCSETDITLHLERKNVTCEFNHVFDEQRTNSYIWKAICLPQINTSEYRTNLLFCYGATASGKTFTMLGSKYIGSSSESVEANSEGLIPRTLLELLRRADVSSITLSALEAYGVHSSQVKIYDLLADDNILNLDFSKKTPLTRTQITNRTYIDIEEESDVETVLQTARNSSHCARTSNNPSSNRGHVLFFVRFIQDADEKQFIFCDLAGSEGESALKGLDKIETEKKVQLRRREAGVIKLGLSDLNTIFDQGFTPSKGQGLRLLLHPYLKWDTKISLCVTLSPSIDHKLETTSTFRFVRSTQMCKLESLLVEREEVKESVCVRCANFEEQMKELEFYRRNWKQNEENHQEKQQLETTKEKMNQIWLSIVDKRKQLETERRKFEEEKRQFKAAKEKFLRDNPTFLPEDTKI